MNYLRPNYEQGFTLVELMVAISIMVILSTVMLVNLAGQRAPRDIKIAQNELVTNIRQVQSNTLSSRLLPSGQEAQYYLLKFDLSTSTRSQYTIQAVINASSQPQLVDVQTIKLPPNIQFAAVNAGASIYPIKINRPNYPTEQDLTSSDCALIAFLAPFGRVLLNKGCAQLTVNPPYIKNGDGDYYNVTNFVTNTSCLDDPAVCGVSSDSIMTITLSDAAKTVFKTITVNAVTGAITFN